jgi:choline-sulfatase
MARFLAIIYPGPLRPYTCLWKQVRLVSFVLLTIWMVVRALPLSAQSPVRPTVILISVDTLRADHLSCYGYRKLQTPHLDAIAHGGTLFTEASSAVPLTLPSHTTMLTSTYPFSNGVDDNGTLVPSGTVTMAGLLKSRGYRTAAFVGGFVLDRRFGLNQGFDVYDSPFNLRRQRHDDPGDVKRPGGEVVESAIEWVKSTAGAPFFLFLHLYDLHAPYELPSTPPLPLGNAGYDKALAYEDEIVGRFWDFLSRQGLLEKALIIFTSDHGESLGEHGESSHGYFVYQSTLRVPLIIHWPQGTPRTPARVDHPASLLDLSPTVLRHLGIHSPPEFQGRPLQELMVSRQGGKIGTIYGESLYARNHFDCAPLRTLRLGRYKYIQAPRPEFYDLSADPNETRNLYSQQQTIAHFYQEQLKSLRARFPAARSPKATLQNPEVTAALQSLGYLTSGKPAAPTAESAADPKDRIMDFEESRRAMDLAASGIGWMLKGT